jgi:hypothetical protein
MFVELSGMLIVVANDPGLAREPTRESKSSMER